MPPPKTPGEAIARRLLSYAPLVAKVGNRITPNTPEEPDDPDDAAKEPEPYVVFQRSTGGEGTTLEGGTRLKGYLYRLDVYGTTDAAAEEILALCQERLFGKPKDSIPPWRELADGVQGCFPRDDADADTLPDGSQANGQTFAIYFAPQV